MSQRSSVRVARGGLRPVRDKRGKNNRRSINRGCKHRKQIRQSNNSHQKQFFFIFVKTGLLQYNTTNKGSRPEIQDDPEERGRGKEESRRSSTPPTRDSAPCRRRTSVEINFRRETTSSKIQNRRC